MNSYPEYVESNSYWFDKVPSHWNKTRNKFVFISEKEVVGNQWGEYDLLTMGKGGVRIRDLDGGGKFPGSFENYQVVKPDQLVFCLFDLDETPRTVGLSSNHGMITSAYDVFSTNVDVDSRFINYFYQSIDDVKGLRPYYTGLRKVVRSETFGGITIYIPPLYEQNLISKFLDKKTSQIDSLIEKTQRKILLLKEQRTSLINQCVTKGLDPNVEMKDSGIEWIGEIPKHWKVSRIKYLSKIISKGTTPSTIGEDTEDTGEIRYLKSENIVDGQVLEKPSFYISKDTDELIKRSRLLENDVLVVIAGAMIGKTAILRKELTPSNTNQAVCFIRPIEDWHSGLIYTWMYSEYIKRVIQNGSVVSAQPNLSMENLGNFYIPIPPKNEWSYIYENLEVLLKKISDIQIRNLKKIELLKEYRQSLISNVVTGKVRVTEDMI